VHIAAYLRLNIKNYIMSNYIKNMLFMMVVMI